MTQPTLKHRRERIGLSQQEVAERARCSIQYVRMIESGYRPQSEVGNPTYDRVLAALDDAERTAA